MKLTKHLAILTITATIVSSCKQKTSSSNLSSAPQNQIEKITTEIKVNTKTYPDLIFKMFDKHGGIENWNTMHQLSFDLGEGDDKETTITALHSRKARIDTKNDAIGFDGTKVWSLEKSDKTYEGNAKFYYNLMFYFYAMPFVLGDDGIIYEEVPPLEFEDISYPGMMISYKSDVGLSPDDQYIVYVHPKTGEMEWLGYTVTYFSKEKSKKFSFIRYTDWQTVNGIKLPKTLTWYTSENNLPTTVRNSAEFKNVSLKNTINADLFTIPEGAKIVE